MKTDKKRQQYDVALGCSQHVSINKNDIINKYDAIGNQAVIIVTLKYPQRLSVSEINVIFTAHMRTNFDTVGKYMPSSETTGEPSMMTSVSFDPSSKPSNKPISQPSTIHSQSSYPSIVPTVVLSLSHLPSMGTSELPSLLP